MTIDQSGIFEIGSQTATARSVRALATAFLRTGGLASAGDLAVTGDPSDLAVNIAIGTGFVQYRAARQHYEPFEVDAAEQVNLLTATATRTDLIYAAVQSKEFGDALNLKSIMAARGTDGSAAAVPPVAVMAGTLPLARVLIPAGAVRGSQCTITMIAGTIAPVRDGGFTTADLAPGVPQTWQKFFENETTGSGGYGGYKHGAPFTPIAGVMVPQFPNDPGDVGTPGFMPGVFHVTHCDETYVYGKWFDVDGTAAPSGANFSAYFYGWADNT